MPRNSMFSANTEASLTHSSTGLLLSRGQAHALVSSPSIFQRLSWLALPASMTLAAQGSVLAHIWKGGQNEGRLFFQLVKFFYYISLFMGMCTYMCGCVCRSMRWRTEDRFQESVLSFCHVEPGLRILVIRQRTRCCYPLSLCKKENKQTNKFFL